MSEYGYIPESPAQSWGSNKGIFTPNDIYDLTRDDKFTDYGQLDLIQTQDISGAVAQVDFTAIKSDIYNVHFLTYNNIQIDTDANEMGIRVGFGSTPAYYTGGYEVGMQEGNANNSWSETRSTSMGYFRLGGDTGTGSNECANGYAYLYNLGDSTKYSFVTQQCITWDRNPYAKSVFGSASFQDVQSITALRCFITTGNLDKGNISLYGLRFYT